MVAADASVLMPALRARYPVRMASADQRLFALYLPGAELCLHARLYGAQVPERQMLFYALEQLGPGDVQVLDRGYPASWLVAHLLDRGISFCMRCDKANGWEAMRDFLQSHQNEAIVQLRAPSAQDSKDYECSGAAPQVRLVRCVSSTGQVRVMATNLPAQDFPASVFGELYHQRWRIEEAFKRLNQASPQARMCLGADAAGAAGGCGGQGVGGQPGCTGVHGSASSQPATAPREGVQSSLCGGGDAALVVACSAACPGGAV